MDLLKGCLTDFQRKRLLRRDLDNGLILSGKGEEVKANVHIGEVLESRVTELLTGLLFPGVQIQGSWRRKQELVHTNFNVDEFGAYDHGKPCMFKQTSDLST